MPPVSKSWTQLLQNLQQCHDEYAKYRYSAGEQAHILFSVGIRDADELSSLMQRLNDRNMPTQDLSGIEAAQVLTDTHTLEPLHVLPAKLSHCLILATRQNVMCLGHAISFKQVAVSKVYIQQILLCLKCAQCISCAKTVNFPMAYGTSAGQRQIVFTSLGGNPNAS